MKFSWQEACHYALESLRALVRLDTTNPPGNERIAADYLSAELGRFGIEAVIRESRPTRASLVARLRGRDSSTPPLMMSAHTDVVPVERSGWRVEPFSGDVGDGCVWGRGTLDMKSKCAMDLLMIAAIRRSGAIPDRDLILAAVADEEAGSELGAKFLVDQHPELVRAGYVLNEVGGFTAHFGDRRFYPIQVAEKGIVTLKMTVKDTPGHGSVPRQNTAITKVAEMIVKIANTPMRRRATPLVRSGLNWLGLSPETVPAMLEPMVSNTATPTIVNGGYKDNVIPGEASVVLDGRTLPGEDPESFCAELRAIVGAEPTMELLRSAPAAEFSTDTRLFGLIKHHTEAADPGAEVLPWMIPAATDSKYYARLGAVCYGFSPIKLDATIPFGSLYHAHDERLPIEGFFWGLKLYARVVLDFAGIKFEDVFA